MGTNFLAPRTFSKSTLGDAYLSFSFGNVAIDDGQCGLSRSLGWCKSKRADLHDNSVSHEASKVYHKLGNIGFLAFSGAALFTDMLPYFTEASCGFQFSA